MLLNRFETVMMNNPVRAALQRHVEARMLTHMGGNVRGKRCLEVGCGRGRGAEIIFDVFGAAEVDAFDLDPKMVALARARLASRGRSVRLWQGSVTRIEADDSSYDAVFDFGIIHHVPDWRAALSEIHRVLKPGGRFYCEEVLDRFILHPVWRRVLDHPMHDRFDRKRFGAALQQAGFTLQASRELWRYFAWFVADKPLDRVAC
jgi:ubiquinone/menaquinone biosynthesis C-methylase UbiE